MAADLGCDWNIVMGTTMPGRAAVTAAERTPHPQLGRSRPDRRSRGTTSGLGFLDALATGKLPPPPIMSTLGFEGLDAGPGWARFTLTPREHHYNPIGSVHGGVAATLLDSALGCAVHSALPAGKGYTTVDLRVTFVRALTRHDGHRAVRGSGHPRGRAGGHRRGPHH